MATNPKKVTLKRTGAWCSVEGLGEFATGDTKEVTVLQAAGFRGARGWEVLERPKPSPAKPKAPKPKPEPKDTPTDDGEADAPTQKED